jgi:signal transduction histidine kinase
MFRTLRAKLIFSYAAIAVLSLLLALVVTLALARDYSKSRGFSTLQEKKALALPLVGFVILDYVSENQNRRTPRKPLAENIKVSISRAGLRVLLLDPQTMRVIEDTAPAEEMNAVGEQPIDSETPGLKQALASGRGQQGTFTLPDEKVTFQYIAQRPPLSTIRNLLGFAQGQGGLNPAAQNQPSPYIVVFAHREPGIRELIEELRGYVMPAVLVALLFSLGVAFLLARSISRPVVSLAKASAAIARGDYTQRLPVRGRDELATLTHEFNAMASEVGKAYQMQRDFIANVSHDLKTPLTSVQGFSQAILDGAIKDEQGYRQAAAIINGEAQRMGRLVSDLLDLSRLQGGLVALELRPVELGPVLAQLVLSMQPQAGEAGVQLVAKLGTPPGAMVLADVDRLREALGNLIDNAIKYTPEGGTVTVAAQSTQAGVEVAVSDTGQGIPPEDLPRITERFYQVDKARSPGNGRSVGLGLAIVREIVLAHHGQMEIESTVGVGTTVRILLPGQGAQHGQPRNRTQKRSTATNSQPATSKLTAPLAQGKEQHNGTHSMIRRDGDY